MKGTQLTVWREPDELMDSEYGRIPYLKWCDLEIPRLLKGVKGVTYRIQNNDRGIALFRIKV